MNVFVIVNVAIVQLIADYEKKTQHRWRCSTHNLRKPRVACTIVWQPWAIKSATPTALKCAFYNTFNANIRINKWQNEETFQ